MRKNEDAFTFTSEVIIPVFLSVLGSMFLCAFIAIHGPGLFAGSVVMSAKNSAEFSNPAPQNTVLTADGEDEKADKIQELYADLNNRDWVIEFFGSLCGSREVAEVILANAAARNIPPSLAFALCREESHYNPHAINTKNRDESIDRGLFQLNSKSFPALAVVDFYDPGINAQYGMSHLRFCLDSGGTEIAALAMYNAGTGRVRTQGAPKMTLDYIQRILETRQKIETSFDMAALEASSENLVVKVTKARLFRLAPLSGR
ncbi:MAG: lytic transglycosylase domain-containing protein [Treponema sp.]|nr:lytic transglycosylase domain-containing protein [Treponema sp.]